MNTYIHRVNFYECDSMGITHHSNYIRFMEEARIDFLDQIGYGFDKMEAEGLVSPVMAVECKYKKPTKFKDEIAVEVYIKEISTFKITIGYSMKVSGVEVCTAESLHCFFHNNRPVVIADRLPILCDYIRK